MPSLSPILIVALSTCLFAGGMSLMRVYADDPERIMVLMIALGLCLCGNGGLLILMKSAPLAAVSTASAAAHIVLMACISAFGFGDRITPAQWLGVALAVIAVAVSMPRQVPS